MQSSIYSTPCVFLVTVTYTIIRNQDGLQAITFVIVYGDRQKGESRNRLGLSRMWQAILVYPVQVVAAGCHFDRQINHGRRRGVPIELGLVGARPLGLSADRITARGVVKVAGM